MYIVFFVLKQCSSFIVHASVSFTAGKALEVRAGYTVLVHNVIDAPCTLRKVELM